MHRKASILSTEDFHGLAVGAHDDAVCGHINGKQSHLANLLGRHPVSASHCSVGFLLHALQVLGSDSLHHLRQIDGRVGRRSQAQALVSEVQLGAAAIRPEGERSEVRLAERGHPLPRLTLSCADGIVVQVGNQVAEHSCVRAHTVKARPCSREFGIARQPSNAALECEHLVDGDDEHERRAVEPLPGSQVDGVRGKAFPRRLMQNEYVLDGTRLDGRTRPDLPPDVVERSRFVLRLTLCRLVLVHRCQRSGLSPRHDSAHP